MLEYTETLEYKVTNLFNFMQPKSQYHCRMEAMTPEERE